MASNVTVQLQGVLLTKPATCNGSGSVGSSGPVFNLALRTVNASATSEETSMAWTLDSAVAFVPLSISPSMRLTVLYLRVTTSAPILVRLTFEASAQIVVPVSGSLLLEFPADDRVSLVELQGQGQVEWLAAGAIV